MPFVKCFWECRWAVWAAEGEKPTPGSPWGRTEWKGALRPKVGLSHHSSPIPSCLTWASGSRASSSPRRSRRRGALHTLRR